MMKNNICYYTLENEYISAVIMNMGATLVSFADKKSGVDIVLGFDSYEGYLDQQGSYMGATVGRCANRIANGHFILNGKEYHLSKNSAPHSLHGGIQNFSFKIFDAKQEGNKVLLTYFSKDHEEGYPGNLKLEVEYRLENHSLVYTFKGISDQDTIMNITNHSYFNLNGEGDILSHELQINTDRVALNDENSLATEKIINVKGTVFDFQEFHQIKECLKRDGYHVDGYDHNYVFENFDMKKMAMLKNDHLLLEVTSDLPDMHLYTANHLDGTLKGKKNQCYQKYAGICFECQYYPNAINYEHVFQPILLANQPMKHFIKYTLKELS
ncbi:aldose epimerase family protein [Traorella massiliensis]|uniref:aldose epimerase family protein n=1 Tax=Traorella massiliensis TaxID=1903263 RepID=UPI0008F8BEA5|nr:aldose epimerase family protein [Traorella massiliensis]